MCSARVGLARIAGGGAVFKDENDFVRFLGRSLMIQGHLVFPQNSHVTHGRTRYKPGTPDLLVCSRGGLFYGIEAKMKGKGLTESQNSMRELFRAADLSERYLIWTPEDECKL